MKGGLDTQIGSIADAVNDISIRLDHEIQQAVVKEKSLEMY